jgi:hypothetical protein
MPACGCSGRTQPTRIADNVTERLNAGAPPIALRFWAFWGGSPSPYLLCEMHLERRGIVEKPLLSHSPAPITLGVSWLLLPHRGCGVFGDLAKAGSLPLSDVGSGCEARMRSWGGCGRPDDLESVSHPRAGGNRRDVPALRHQGGVRTMPGREALRLSPQPGWNTRLGLAAYEPMGFAAKSVPILSAFG